jgi:FdhE protein
MTTSPLLAEWSDLLKRRPTFRDALRGYVEILNAWGRWPDDHVSPLAWDAAACRERWARGVPLLAETVPAIAPDALEDLLIPAMELIGMIGREEAALQRFAQAWDRGEVAPAALLPGRGSLGSPSVRDRIGLSAAAFGFLSCAGLRPALERYFAESRAHLAEGVWSLGVCPYCGAPPGFTDILENGGRRLVCHFCASGWTFPRLQCPFCGTTDAQQFVKFQAEDKEEGYLISACKACHAYLKELDRRVRWNGASALVEDWGSPHLDVLAHRAGYWRAIPTLIELEQATRADS